VNLISKSYYAWRFLQNLKLIWSRKDGKAGMLITAFIVLIAVAAPILSPKSPYTQVLEDKLKPPSLQYPFGTDHLGRDLMSRIFHGARASLIVGVFSVLVAIVIGVPLGLIAGYYGGLIDQVIEVITSAFWSFPTFLIALAFAAAFGPGLQNVLIAIGVAWWAGFARIVRGEVLSLRERRFIEAVRCLGANDAQIIVYHILPNCINPLLVYSILNIPSMILIEASLSFLGIGIQPPHPSWGNIIGSGRPYLREAPWIVMFPTAFLALTLIGLILLGDAVSNVLNPRLRRRMI